MGYSSTTLIVVPKFIVDQAKLIDGDLPKLLREAEPKTYVWDMEWWYENRGKAPPKDADHSTICCWHFDGKWYGHFPDVTEVDKWLGDLSDKFPSTSYGDEDCFGLYRYGDDDTDVEHKGDPSVYGVDFHREFTYPGG